MRRILAVFLTAAIVVGVLYLIVRYAFNPDLTFPPKP